MAYSAARHITKSGKSSTQYNIMCDITGTLIGRCTSHKSALALVQELNNHELRQLQYRFFQEFSDSHTAHYHIVLQPQYS